MRMKLVAQDALTVKKGKKKGRSGRRKRKTMPKQKALYTTNKIGQGIFLKSCDILQTRRIIVNDIQNMPPESSNYLPLVDPNTANTPLPLVQFSSTLLTAPRCTTHTNQPTFRRYFHTNQPKTEAGEDDDVVFIGSTASETLPKPPDSNVITINDNGPSDYFTVETTSRPDLSKFSIMVTNSECALEQSDDSVVCIEPANVSAITVDDDTDVEEVVCPVRRRSSRRWGAINKKKNLVKKVQTVARTAKSGRKYITFDERPSVRQTVVKAPQTGRLQSLSARENAESMSLEQIMAKTGQTGQPQSLSTQQSEHVQSLSLEQSAAVKDAWSNIGTNLYNSEPIKKTGLREIVIDGSNVALGHTNGTTFSVEGLKIAIDYFVQRGHKVRAFVPQYRKNFGQSSNRDLICELIDKKYVVLTPSRYVTGKRITPYDDRFVIQYAALCEGIVVSSDNYRDLWNEKPEWRDTIANRLLMPTWVDNVLMFPEDPLGRTGPKLADFLKFPDS